MALRFRKSVKLAPGLRLNFSGSGLSLSAGPRGASVTFGSRGTYLNTGIPGTGFSSRTMLSGGSSASPRATAPSAPQKVNVSMRVTLEDNGTVKFIGPDGEPASEYLISQAKRQQGDAIRRMLEETVARQNSVAEQVGSIHLSTPAPSERVRYQKSAFAVPQPLAPAPKPYTFWSKFFASKRSAIDIENALAAEEHQKKHGEWATSKATFEQEEREREDFLERKVLTDPEAMEEHLERALEDIAWPRETSVSFEVHGNGALVLLDVDLPEIEDMPRQTWSAGSRGYKVSVKEIGKAKVERMYMEHVHGLGFRLIGEVFALLPSVKGVVLSAYSQRPDKATGEIVDEYLYSARVRRSPWEEINFANLAAIDVVEALARFDLVRDMTKGGRFKAIEPIARADRPDAAPSA